MAAPGLREGLPASRSCVRGVHRAASLRVRRPELIHLSLRQQQLKVFNKPTMIELSFKNLSLLLQNLFFLFLFVVSRSASRNFKEAINFFKCRVD